MLYTLADARTACGKFVDSGSCDNAVIDQRVNEALERLMAEEPWESLRRIIRVAVQGKCFALPWTAEKALFLDTNGVPSRLFNRAYQFMDAGPGDAQFRTNSGTWQDTEDLGDWPVMFELPTAFNDADDADVEVGETGWRLAAFTTLAADATKTVSVEGTNSYGEVITDTVAIHRWSGGTEGTLVGTWDDSIPLSTYSFANLSKISLPTGRTSYVSLYAVDPSTNYTYFLAKYHPSQTIPQFRRYRITNQGHEDDANVLVMVQLRYIPLSLADDLLLINSTQSVKLMVMAISKENAGELKASVGLADQAIRLLTKAEEASTLAGGVPTVIDTQRRTSLGYGMHHRVLL